MDFNKLYYFYTVAKLEHVTRAAETLHIAQPAVTKSIRQLEAELDVKLLEKSGRNVQLTPYGKHLKQRLDAAFPILTGIPDELAAMKQANRRSVRLNVLAASSVVTEAVIAYQQNHTDTAFYFVQHEEKNKCDVTISTNDRQNRSSGGCLERCVIEEQIFLAVPKDSHYAARSSVDLAELSEEKFVGLAMPRSFRSICDVLCACAGFVPQIAFESDSPETVKNIIKANVGVAFWPEFSWGEAQDICLLPIRTPLCQRELIVELHETAAESEAARDFFEYLVKHIKQQQMRARRGENADAAVVF